MNQRLLRPSGSPFSPLSLNPAFLASADVVASRFQERTGASATTPAVLDTDPVGTLLEQSVNASYWTTPTADSKRPTLDLNVQNGKPGFLLDGTDDRWIGSLALGTSHTGFFVCKPTTTLNSLFSGAGDSEFLLVLNTAKYDYQCGAGVNNYATISIAPVPGVAQILAVRRSGTSVSFWKNGVQLGLTQTMPLDNPLTLTMLGGYVAGGGYDYTGHYFSMPIFGYALSDPQMAYMFNGLNAEWGIY